MKLFPSFPSPESKAADINIRRAQLSSPSLSGKNDYTTALSHQQTYSKGMAKVSSLYRKKMMKEGNLEYQKGRKNGKQKYVFDSMI